ncbi:MAG: iron ABC transporter permease [Cardiobacteriaceae bacterium]|nr:iron ABC transporter permease [Cardiobacteriaceae bacterium]
MEATANWHSRNVWRLVSLMVAAFCALFILMPLVLVLYKAVVHPESGAFTTEYLTKFFTKKFYWSTLVNSMKVTVVSTLLAAAIGVPMAYIMTRYRIRGAAALNILIVISYLSPPFIGAYAWIQLLGRSGVVTQWINDLFGIQFNGIYGFAGILLVFSLQSFPLIYMYVCGALKSMDASLIEAAESLGCKPLDRMRRIVIPLIMPTLLAGSLLIFMRVFSDFGTPMLIGEGFKTMPVLVYNQFMSEVGGDDGFAAALCLIVITLTMFLFFAQRLISERGSYAMSALKPMEKKAASGVKNALLHGVVYGVVALAVIPQAVVIYTSFLETKGGQVYTGEYSLENYAAIFAKDTNAIWNTYSLGFAAIVLIVLIGVLVAYLTVRHRNLVNSAIDTVTMFPYIIPGSVLGIAFLFAFNSPPLLLSGTALILIISYVIRRMPYTVRSTAAIIGQISPSIEEAAVSLGASDGTTFRKVLLPMIVPGILSGAIMSWVTVISELSSSIILYTSQTQTLTVSIYTEVIRGNYGNASAFSTILTVTSILSLLLFFKLTGRRDIAM